MGAAATTALAAIFQDAFGWTEKAGCSGVGAIFGIIAATAVLITALKVRERPAAEVSPAQLPPMDAVKKSFRSPGKPTPRCAET